MQMRTNLFSSSVEISLKFTNEIAQILGKVNTWYLGWDKKRTVKS